MYKLRPLITYGSFGALCKAVARSGGGVGVSNYAKKFNTQISDWVELAENYKYQLLLNFTSGKITPT